LRLNDFEVNEGETGEVEKYGLQIIQFEQKEG